MWAIVVAVLVSTLSVKLLKSKQLPARIKGIAYILISLIVVQLALGMLNHFLAKSSRHYDCSRCYRSADFW